MAYLHPPPAHIFKLWHIFLDNVHPLTKIVHAPTLQPQILEASLDMTQAPRALEALMFAIYFCAVTSLDETQCQRGFNETRSELRSRFHGATMGALMKANLFSTSDIVLLQASILFIMGVSGSCDPGELWVMLGTVIRIAQRLRLPEKAVSSRIPVLDAEISRRICWQLSLLDARGAEIYGVRNTGIIKYGLTPLPLNVNDSDICKNTLTQPRGQSGATEMMFLLLKYEGANFVCQSDAMSRYGGSWVTLSSHAVPIQEKNNVISELECLLEEKYLRFCDPTIPLHQLAILRTRLVLNRMRLTTRHPRRRLTGESQLSPEENIEFVKLCLEILADDNLLHTTPEIKKYLWHISCHSHIDAIVYLLGELREHRIPEWEETTWLRITAVFDHHPEMISSPDDHLTKALSQLVLQSWGSREQRAGLLTNLPSCIARLRQHFVTDSHRSSAESYNIDTSLPFPGEEGTAHLHVSDSVENLLDTLSMPDFSSTDGFAAVDWDYWNSLLGEASNGI
ncbi:uncharacterized protein N7529_003685 [Penicillium soppii]|uniref:uncharacterized protein n=1 Tax=Penicillium soppii TaxID=69789 RepID=UPI0025499B23|nr:uncharacterized protein N7529_003685 [Penicillium soppii]KAJ5871332.1 hypothetical protein N7529_003685 [Penicillium soppii]